MHDEPTNDDAPTTRAAAEEWCLLWCVHAGHATTSMLLDVLGLSPSHATALGRTLDDLAQRALLETDGDAYAISQAGLARLDAKRA